MAGDGDAVETRDPRESRGPRVGATFAGRYRIESLLGEGGFGAVWAARKPEE